MKLHKLFVATILALGSGLLSCGQSWKPVLPAGHGIDWSTAGVGGIPARPQICARLKPPSNVDKINFALSTCGDGRAVFLEAGSYTIDGTILVPSNVTLRGAGADLTILKAAGRAGGDVISMGSGSVPYDPIAILGGATAGSNELELKGSSGIKPGMLLVIAEVNDPKFVTATGSSGLCIWCDGGWTDSGRIARGQIVEVKSVGKN